VFTVYFSSTDIEKLIEIVRKHEILYCTTSKSYKNVLKKEEAWEIVANEVGESVTGL